MPSAHSARAGVPPHGNPQRGRGRSNRRRLPMPRITLSAIAVSLLAFTINAGPAQAQTRVFVAAQGSDANPCTFALPCRTFQKAHDTVAAGGEIDVLDPAGYGSVTITKAISIQGHGFSGVSVPSGATGITITAPSSAAVNLNGLLLEGTGVGFMGILFNSGKSLTIANCLVRNFTSHGIMAIPAAVASFVVSNTLVADNGGNGILVLPSGTLVMKALFNRVEVYNNAQNGIEL